jgi:predicted dehydrogenase
MKRVGVGIIGAGFISETRMRCYRAVRGYNVELTAVADIDGSAAERFAECHGIPHHVTDYRRVLSMDEVDMVDLCVPNSLHTPMILAAAEAGKHVVCSKPLTGFFGRDLPREAVAGVPRRDMLQQVMVEGAEVLTAVERAGIKLMYAENWVYAPPIEKARRLIKASGGVILEIRGGERHSGSHSPFSKIWQSAGGGALLRLGIHSVGAALHLKGYEGLLRTGQPIRAVSVMADVANMERVAGYEEQGRHYLVRGWQDVENWGLVIVTFSDGSRGILYGADTLLGGMESKLELVLSNARIRAVLRA